MDLKSIFDIATGVATVAWMLIGILIKQQLSEIRITQAQDKADLIKSQSDVKEELVRRTNETAQEVAVHKAEDDLKFSAINGTLARIEIKLNQG